IILDDLPKLTWQTGRNAAFVATTTVEREAVARIVPALLGKSAPDLASLQPDAVRAGLRLEIWELGGETFYALLEEPTHRRGAGAYIFRTEGAAAPILLEAPHSDHDLGTGEIAGAMFFTPPPGARKARALFMNTIHRYQVEPGRRQKRADNPADVAHNPDHLY